MHFIKYKTIVINLLTAIILAVICCACTETNKPETYISYAGSWKCDETSSINGYLKPYIVYIDKSSADSTAYIIRNFFDLGNNQMIGVKIDGKSIEIIQQPTSGQVLRTFNGLATSFTQLKLQYTIYDGERDIFYEANYTRK